MRLIDADTLVDRFVPKQSYFTEDIKIKIETAQAVDAAPVKHGKWEEPEPEGIISYNRGSYAQCSVCKKKSYLGRADKYCRYCGAKMDLEE